MNIRSHIISLLIFTLIALTTSCSDNKDFMPDGDVAMVNLTLQIPGKKAPATRTISGEDALNENVINTVDVFLYKVGGALSGEQPVYYSTDIVVSNYNATDRKATITLSLPLNSFNLLFPSEDVVNCDAYIVVNRQAASGDDNVYPTEDLSMASIKGNTILYAPTFQEREQHPVTFDYSTIVQNSFVMDGFATITRNNLTLAGTVPVERVAVKVSLIIDGIKDNVEDSGGKFWNADKTNVKITMCSGSNRTYLGTMPTEYIYNPNKSTDLYDVPAIAANVASGDDLTTKYPFYTYPTNWGTDEESRTYFTLVVNWVRTDDNTITKTTYYEIPVNPAGTYLKRNTYYKIKQKVEVLGSTEEASPVVLYPCNYIILDWGNTMIDSGDTDVDAEINKLKYLVVDETQIEMNNTQSEQFYYFSSDEIEIKNLKVERIDVTGNTAVSSLIANLVNPTAVDNTYTVSSTKLKNPVKISLQKTNDGDDSRTYLLFEHELVNDMNQDSDYSEYVVTFDVQHIGDNTYKETIKITQYPMIAIVADLNSDYKDDNIANNDNTNKGYVIINNQTTDNTNWSAVRGLAGKNKNPNRYIVTVNSLTEGAGNEYIIGDPRSKTVKKFTGINEDDNNRALTYYYPTNTDEMTRQMIAPQFMMASSYGVCDGDMGYSDAEKRCATYQEDGYPAGRWRVPTQAEAKYIIQLSGWNVIPVLFNDGSNYWSAHTVVVNNGGVFDTSTSTKAFVRCVYDTWYWGKERVDENTFTYGDKQR